TVAVLRPAIRDDPDGLVADAPKAQPEAHVHARLNTGRTRIPSVFTKRVEQPYSGYAGKRSPHGRLEPSRYFIVGIDLTRKPDRKRLPRCLAFLIVSFLA